MLLTVCPRSMPLPIVKMLLSASFSPPVVVMFLTAALSGVLPFSRAAIAPGDVQTIYDNACETLENDGTILYSACAVEPLSLLRPNNARLSVTVSPENATCGNPPVSWCTLGIRNCGFCNNAVPENSHPIEFIFDSETGSSNPNLETWWQSVPWTNNPAYPEVFQVNITLSFDSIYEMTSNLEILFRTSRPRNMTLLKSLDGETWSVLQYYRRECSDLWNTTAAREVTADRPDAVLCTQEYSSESPYQDGTVIFNVDEDRYRLFTGPTYTDYQNLYQAFATTNLDEFLSFKDLRIWLQYPATDGNEALRHLEDQIRYYYAVSDVTVWGERLCNLHAQSYETNAETNQTVCTCSHNTMGARCTECLPLYNNRPWAAGQHLPYPLGIANECEKCQCNDHASSCQFDPDIGFGRCLECQHNTTGPLCDQCLDGFFRNLSFAVTDANACSSCNCEPLGILNNDLGCTQPNGQCTCKQLVTGRACDICIAQYYGLLLEEAPGECKFCSCNLDGTVDRSNVCERREGQCPCKPNIEGRTCSQCQDGFYNFPVGRPFDDCLDCACDPGGSENHICNVINGQCTCRPNIQSQYCNITVEGFYAPSLDFSQHQPTLGSCVLDTDIIHEEDPFTGSQFSRCRGGQETGLGVVNDESARLIQSTVTQQYTPAIRYSLNSTLPWSPLGFLTLAKQGNSNVDLTPYRTRSPDPITDGCPTEGADPVTVFIDTFNPGIGEAWLSPVNVSLDVRCLYLARLTLQPNTIPDGPEEIVVDSMVLLPLLESTLVYQQADDTLRQQFVECQQNLTALTRQSEALQVADCRRLAFSATTQLAFGALPCDCDLTGTVPGTLCSSLGGQCQCKPGVFGRRCDQCQPGYFNFTDSGCELCDYIPCPDTFVKRERKDDSDQMILIIVIAIMLVLLIIILLVIFVPRKNREKLLLCCKGLLYKPEIGQPNLLSESTVLDNDIAVINIDASQPLEASAASGLPPENPAEPLYAEVAPRKPPRAMAAKDDAASLLQSSERVHEASGIQQTDMAESPIDTRQRLVVGEVQNPVFMVDVDEHVDVTPSAKRKLSKELRDKIDSVHILPPDLAEVKRKQKSERKRHLPQVPPTPASTPQVPFTPVPQTVTTESKPAIKADNPAKTDPTASDLDPDGYYSSSSDVDPLSPAIFKKRLISKRQSPIGSETPQPYESGRHRKKQLPQIPVGTSRESDPKDYQEMELRVHSVRPMSSRRKDKKQRSFGKRHLPVLLLEDYNEEDGSLV